MGVTKATRKFVPKDLDCSDWSQIEPLHQTLLNRDLNTADELEKWLLDVSELDAVLDEFGTWREIDMSCHTDDPKIEKAYIHFVENIKSRIKPLFFKLQKKYLYSTYRDELSNRRYDLLERRWHNEVDIFRDKNVPLQTEETKIISEYDKLLGAMMPIFNGKKYTLKQLSRYLDEPDRNIRKRAWETIAIRILEDRNKFDELFERLLSLRIGIATNADLKDYREYQWNAKYRFDYSHLDCEQFANSVENLCVPLMEKLYLNRVQDLGIENLRPWDLSVDPKNSLPLRPFDPKNTAELVDKMQDIFNRILPELGDEFFKLKVSGNLDLECRKGKRPGGYMTFLAESRQPFIFMNAIGRHNDVSTLLHETGHAFHLLAASRNEPLVFLQQAPIEFCEVASMTMELIGINYLDVFYNPTNVARAKRAKYKEILTILTSVAIVDSFQHWLYTHHTHSKSNRTSYWLELENRFTPAIVDWSGYEMNRESRWHIEMQIFRRPFYIIEYGIAQLGALQIWLRYRKDPEATMTDFLTALSLGATRPLPELFEAAGIKFDFSQSMMQTLMDEIEKELEELPS